MTFEYVREERIATFAEIACPPSYILSRSDDDVLSKRWKRACLLFLFRIRFGLYATLQKIVARLDWAALEDELTSHV